MSSDFDWHRMSRMTLGALGAGASAAFLLQLAACASTKPVQSDSASCSAVVDYPREDIFTSSGTAHLSSRALAYFAFGYDSANSRQRRSQGYVLVVRGQPHWFETGGLIRSGGQAQGSERRVHLWEVAGRQLTVVFDPAARVVQLLGERVALDTANVIFLDRADDIGGPTVVRGTSCVRRLRINTIAKDLLDGVPALARYASANGGA